jgi:SAM-dependent methyltransferase
MTGLNRLHLGCGSVYLDQFTNCDVNIPGHFLASERPDLILKNRTTVDNYYKNKVSREQLESGILQKNEVVVDVFARAENIPFADNSIDEIRMYQVFEHFTLPVANVLLQYWHRKLTDNGKLFLDIPDVEETAKGFVEAKTEMDKDWYIRLLYGSQKNEFGIHKMMYSKNSISRLLLNNHYDDLTFYPNIHLNPDGSVLYPAFGVEAIKK